MTPPRIPSGSTLPAESSSSRKVFVSGVGTVGRYCMQLLEQAGFRATCKFEDDIDFVLMEIDAPKDASKRWVVQLKRKFAEFEPARKSGSFGYICYMPKGNGRTFIQTLEVVRNASPELLARCAFVRSPEDAVSSLLTFDSLAEVGDAWLKADRAAAVVEPAPEWLGAHPNAPSLRNEEGLLDVRLLTKVFPAVTQAQVAALAKISRQALSDTPTSPKAAPVMEQFERLTPLRTIPQLRDDEKFNAWWQRKITPLDGRSPAEAVKAGDLDAVVELAERIVTGDVAG